MKLRRWFSDIFLSLASAWAGWPTACRGEEEGGGKREEGGGREEEEDHTHSTRAAAGQ